ncbi:hypothetical protein KAU33_08805 [Candidatus Dependentiae bacterium]|nr:hypothetical protein [Candidatus Dependentiae bacterium]
MTDSKALLMTSVVILAIIASVALTSFFVNSSYENKYDETTDRMKEKYILKMQSEIDSVGCGQSIESFHNLMYYEICAECDNEFSIIWDYKPGFGAGYYENQCAYDVEEAVLQYRRDVCISQFD